MRVIWIASAALVLSVTVVAVGWRASRAAAQSPASERRLKTEAEIAAESRRLPADSVARRARSMQRLAAEGVPVLASLPVIESEGEARHRPAAEIANRAMALLFVAARAEGLEQTRTMALISQYRLTNELTPEEQAFLATPTMSNADRAKFTWRYEAAWVLLWALGYVERLDRPDRSMDPAAAARIIADRGRDRFVREARLRPLPEILDEADIIYRYHWATDDARVNGRPAPAGLDADVIMERHHALNWLIGYLDQAWDDVTLDT
jgi:hypothetical protein